MNNKANWSKLTSGIKITATYSNAIAPSSVTTVAGTGAMIKTGPQVSATTSGKITMSGLTATQNYASMKITLSDGSGGDLTGAPYTSDESNWTAADGGELVVQLGEAWMNFLDGNQATVTLTMTDGSTATTTVTFAK